MMDQTREIILQLLGTVGSRKEVEQYLRQFSSVEQKRFAVIKVGGALLADSLDDLAASLTFFSAWGFIRSWFMALAPSSILRSMKQVSRPRRSTACGSQNAETLVGARKVMQRINLELVDALEKKGTRARPVTSGVFESELMDSDKFGLVGEIRQIHLDAIGKAIRAGHLPILTCLGETPGGQIVNINADVAARELAISIEPHKIIFLTQTGGLLDENDKVISSINLSEDYEHLMSQDWVSGGMRVKLEQINDLLQHLPLESSVSMTNAQNLPRELFTHRGAGTFIRRGERVLEHESWEDIDREKMTHLLETCFQKELNPDYFESKEVERIYTTETYRATAVITREGGVPYLDKFAVTPKAQGEGLGASVWNRMRADYPTLFWRSRTSNAVNGWYFQQAEGTFRNDTWTVFWYGIEDYEQMRDCAQRARAMPATLESKDKA